MMIRSWAYGLDEGGFGSLLGVRGRSFGDFFPTGQVPDKNNSLCVLRRLMLI
jgi:hypothetical protein